MMFPGHAGLVDYLQPVTLAGLFSGIDAAVLILPQEKTITSMASNLVAAAERAKLKRLVLISFLHADTGVGGPLLRWHHNAEQVVQGAGLAVTCMRPNFYMENFLSAFRPSPELSSGLISYVDARDVAEAVLAVLSRPGHEGATYSLTGPRAYSTEEAIEILEGEIGMPVSLPGRGGEQVCFASRRSSHSEEVQALCEMWQAAADGGFATVTADLAKLIGRPGTTLERFAQDHHASAGPDIQG